MRRRRGVTWVLLTALVVAGCVNYDERVELNPDGSGVVRMHLIVAEQVLPRQLKLNVTTEADLLPVPHAELVRDFEKEGFEVKSLRASSDKGLRHFYVVLGFKSLEQLTKSEFFGGRQVSLAPDGPKWLFEQKIVVSEKVLTDRAARAGKPPGPETGRVSQPEKKDDESLIKQLERRVGKERVRKMLRNFSLNFSVQLKDTGLIRTNGRSHRDTIAVWTLPLDQLVDRRPTLHMQAEFAATGRRGPDRPPGEDQP